MAYQIASFLMTLSKFQGQARVADLVKCDFDTPAAVGKISTDTECCMFPLCQQSLLLRCKVVFVTTVVDMHFLQITTVVLYCTLYKSTEGKSQYYSC